jgi:heat shock protein HslJ
LRIDPVESRYGGNATVNSIFGPAEVDGAALRLKPGGMTRKAGPKDLMQQEGKFVAMLDLVRSYRIEGSTLILLDGEGKTVACFSAPKTSSDRSVETHISPRM